MRQKPETQGLAHESGAIGPFISCKCNGHSRSQRLRRESGPAVGLGVVGDVDTPTHVPVVPGHRLEMAVGVDRPYESGSRRQQRSGAVTPRPGKTEHLAVLALIP